MVAEYNKIIRRLFLKIAEDSKHMRRKYKMCNIFYGFYLFFNLPCIIYAEINSADKTNKQTIKQVIKQGIVTHNNVHSGVKKSFIIDNVRLGY